MFILINNKLINTSNVLYFAIEKGLDFGTYVLVARVIAENPNGTTGIVLNTFLNEEMATKALVHLNEKLL